MNTFIDHQNWRYAAKKYNPQKRVSEDNINFLMEAIRLTPSSYGLQPYKIIIIDNQELRLKLESAAYGQKQISEASHLFVFANMLKIDESAVDEYISNVLLTRPESEDRVHGYGEFIKKTINYMSIEEKCIWTSKQTYLAVGNLLNAAAELKIDSTPFEGFDAKEYNTILNLDSMGLNACLVVTIGYRHDEDKTQFFQKVRKPATDLFMRLH